MLNQLLLLTDMNQGNEQYHINQLLVEFASLFGMRVKTLRSDEFPTGVVFHREDAIMNGIFNGTVKPYLFHMSWTHNRAQKLLFFEQMGEWYVRSICSNVDQTSLASDDITLTEACCSLEPLVSCHYKNLPALPICIGKEMETW